MLTSPGATFRRLLLLLLVLLLLIILLLLLLLHLHLLLLLPLLLLLLFHLLLLLRRRRCRFSLGRTGLLPCTRYGNSVHSEKREFLYLKRKKGIRP